MSQSTYNANDLVTSIEHFDGNGNLLASYTYTYDAGSRMTSQTVNGVTTPYSYDAINELTAAGSTTYSYDANENRTGPAYVIGPNNELLTDGTWNYTYDAEGNLIQKVNIATGETWTYAYNNENQETSATDRAADGTLISQSTYTFDAFGNRIGQAVYTQSSGTTVATQFAYDDAQSEDPNIWADLDAGGSLITRRIFGDNLDQPLVRIDSSGNVAWYLTDHLGSIMALMNNQGQLIDEVTYDAFGNILSETDPSAGDRYKFAGMQLQPDGEYDDDDRVVNPATGRDNQQDPIGVSGDNPNLYPYVANNPTNQVDPTGQQAKDDCASEWEAAALNVGGKIDAKFDKLLAAARNDPKLHAKIQEIRADLRNDLDVAQKSYKMSAQREGGGKRYSGGSCLCIYGTYFAKYVKRAQQIGKEALQKAADAINQAYGKKLFEVEVEKPEFKCGKNNKGKYEFEVEIKIIVKFGKRK